MTLETKVVTVLWTPCSWATCTNHVWTCRALLGDLVFLSAPCLLEGPLVQRPPDLHCHLEIRGPFADKMPDWWCHIRAMTSDQITDVMLDDIGVPLPYHTCSFDYHCVLMSTWVREICILREAFRTCISHHALVTDKLISDGKHIGTSVSLASVLHFNRHPSHPPLWWPTLSGSSERIGPCPESNR